MPGRLIRFLRRNRPSGLLSPAYIWAKPSDRLVCIHRSLWWQPSSSLPQLHRLVWCIRESWLWLRWVIYQAWRENRRCVNHHGTSVQRESGISTSEQFFQCLYFALYWCIPPSAFYQFGLYRPDYKSNRKEALQFIYPHESSSWHRNKNGNSEQTKRDVQLLADKVKTEIFLKDAKLPTIETRYTGDNLTSLLNLLQTNQISLFCKSRFGHGAIGAFEVQPANDQFYVKPLNAPSDPVSNKDQLNLGVAWRSLIKNGQALVQESLIDHEQLKLLSERNEITTIRVISYKAYKNTEVQAAFLEIPTGSMGYTILPLRSSNGALIAPNETTFELPALRKKHLDIWQQTGPTWKLPCWSDISQASKTAQTLFPGLSAIAWDWAITPQGPIILEGNVHFALAALQRQCGGLLSDSLRS